MAQRWRYVRNGQECGPVTTADLRLLADQERLLPTDMVCKDGAAHWVTAGSVKGLFYTGPAPRKGAGMRGATCLIVVGLIGLLAAGGVVVVVYALHGFGAAAPIASPTPPDQTPPDGMGGVIADPPLVIPGDSGGGNVPPVKERVLWRSSKGTFENTGGDQWLEMYDGGTFHYGETGRTNSYIELYDRSRKFTVRLHGDHYDVKVRDKFERRLDGKWEAP